MARAMAGSHPGNTMETEEWWRGGEKEQRVEKHPPQSQLLLFPQCEWVRWKDKAVSREAGKQMTISLPGPAPPSDGDMTGRLLRILSEGRAESRMAWEDRAWAPPGA